MTSKTSLSEILVHYFSSLRFADLPTDVIQKAKELVIDTLGSGIAGSTSEEIRPILDVMVDAGGREDAVIWGHRFRLPTHAAAMVNGAFTHAIEMDDTHRETYLHVGATVLPAVMAVGERVSATGQDILSATIAGYETAIRIARAVSPEHRFRGYHTTATVGVFGAAMAASILLKLNVDNAVNAMGLAGTQSAGLFQFLYDGASAKRFHPGRSAQSGVLAALLAARGFTGSSEILEGTYGFGTVMSDRFNPKTVIDGLGEVWHILEMGIKPYSACRFCHAPIDAALRIRSLDTFDSSTIAKIEVIGSRQLFDQTGDREPKTVMAAQLSTPFMVALALLTGGTMPADIPAGLENPDVVNLARRVIVTVDPGLPRTSRETTVRVEFSCGTKETRCVPLPPGEPETPLSKESFTSKFFALTAPVLNEDRAHEVIELISKLERLERIGRLAEALRADGPGSLSMTPAG